jgi:DNA-directed RNA polymerase II subunit RPB3
MTRAILTPSHRSSPVHRLDQYTEEQKEAVEDCCPTQVFAYDENTKTVVVANPENCIFCKECLFTTEDFRKRPEDKLAVNVKHSKDRFIFTVETTGALTAKEVVKDALAQLQRKLTRLQQLLPQINA